MLAISRLAATAALGLLVLALCACGATHRVGRRVASTASVGVPTSGARLAGDSSLPPGVVALVGRNAITERELEHWAAVEAVTELPMPTRPLPLGVVPDPPGYKSCIAYLAKTAESGRERPVPDGAQLKQRCEQEHEALQQAALAELIRHDWEREEARKERLSVTSAEVEAAILRRFSSEADLRRYLSLTRLRMSDERFLIGEETLDERWYRANIPAYAKLARVKPESEQLVGEIDRGRGSLDERVAETWRPRTRCSTGYVLPECSEYKEG